MGAGTALLCARWWLSCLQHQRGALPAVRTAQTVTNSVRAAATAASALQAAAEAMAATAGAETAAALRRGRDRMRAIAPFRCGPAFNCTAAHDARPRRHFLCGPLLSAFMTRAAPHPTARLFAAHPPAHPPGIYGQAGGRRSGVGGGRKAGAGHHGAAARHRSAGGRIPGQVRRHTACWGRCARAGLAALMTGVQQNAKPHRNACCCKSLNACCCKSLTHSPSSPELGELHNQTALLLFLAGQPDQAVTHAQASPGRARCAAQRSTCLRSVHVDGKQLLARPHHVRAVQRVTCVPPPLPPRRPRWR